MNSMLSATRPPVTSNPEVAAVAQDVRSRLERVRSALTTTASTRSGASHVS
jgi:hypothetical protein